MMRHIKLFENFINEKMGMPAGLKENGDIITDGIWEKLKTMILIDADRGHADLETNGIGYPKGMLNVSIKIIENTSENPLVAGSSTPQNIKIADDGSYETNMNVDIHSYGPTLRKLMTGKDDGMQELRTNIKATVYHEMMHILEEYLRKTTGSKSTSIGQVETLVAHAASGELAENLRLPPPISNFIFLVYLAQAHEVSARVPETYALLQNIKDPHKRLEILKNSKTWEEAQLMINYSADEYIKQTKDILGQDPTNPTWEEASIALANGMKLILPSACAAINDYMQLSNIYATSHIPMYKNAAADIIKSPTLRKALNNASSDFGKFMHEWEGIINRAGAKLKRKLSKVVTATDDI